MVQSLHTMGKRIQNNNVASKLKLDVKFRRYDNDKVIYVEQFTILPLHSIILSNLEYVISNIFYEITCHYYKGSFISFLNLKKFAPERYHATTKGKKTMLKVLSNV